MRRLLTILTLLCLPATLAMARADTTGFIHFSIDNGFPTNNVYSLVQDKNGFLWFATDNGIVKYNGYNFDIYNTDRGLPGNDVWELHEDNTGRMWFNSFSYEFGFLKNGKYKRINYSAENRIIQANYMVNCGDLLLFVQMSDGNFNICFAGDDILKVISFKGEGRYFGEDKNYKNITASTNVGFSYWSGNRKLYKLIYDKQRYYWKERCTIPNELMYMYTSKIGMSPDDQMYAFKVYGKRLEKYNIRTCSYDTLSLNQMGADPSEAIYAMNPYFLQHNQSINTVLITNSHLYTISPDFTFLSRTRNTDILPTSAQLAFRYVDKDGNVWYTTNGDGVWSTVGKSSLYSGLNGMPELQNARYLGEIGSKGYWWDYRKFLLLEIVGNTITKTVEVPSNLNFKSITGNDTVAYLAGAESIYKYNAATGALTNLKDLYTLRTYIFYERGGVTTQENDISMDQLRHIQLIGSDIFGFAAFGILRYRFEDKTISCSRLDEERYLRMTYDKFNSRFCCYSSRRIILGNATAGIRKVLKAVDLDAMGIGLVKNVEIDSLGNIFILDEKNIFLCDSTFKIVKKIPHRFLLSDASIRIHADKLFIAGRFGLAYLDILSKGSVSDFHLAPNRALSHFRKFEDFHISRDGYVILRTNEGVSGFHVDSLFSNSVVTGEPDFFELILLTPFEKKISDKDTIRFGHEDEKMSFDAINFYGSGSVKYTYKIIGKGDWEESTSGEIFLGSLTPGKYYKVVCKIRDDVWESRLRVLYVYRTPYWWQTTAWRTVFWISGILLFLSLVLATVLITRYIVAKKNERKRALVELELRAIHSQINPHFIFNTLSASLFFINKKRFDDAYNHVNKFSKLLRSYLKSSQDRYVMLEEELGMLRNYIDLQQIRFEEKFDYSIEVDNKLPLNNIRIPSLLLQPLVENAINHGLFHKGEGGKLLLKFLQGADSTELICVIDDNGIGREEAKKINETNRTKESYGTKLTNQLLEVFRQYEHFDITIEYTDKELPETGTVVTLILKNIEYVA